MLLNDTHWRSYVGWLIRHPYAVILAVLAVSAFFALQAAQIQLDNTRDPWLPRGNAYVETTREIQEIFGGRDIVVIGVAPRSGDIYQPHVLAKIARLQQRVAAVPEAIRNNVVSLAAPKVRAIRGTADGMEVQRMLQDVPTTAQGMAELRQAIADNPFYVGALVSADQRLATVVADFKMPKDAQGYTDLYNEIATIVAEESEAGIALHVGGAPIAFAGVEIYSNTAGPKFFLAAFCIIMAVQILVFRSVQGMLLPMLTAALSTLWALGFMRLCGLQLNSINTTTCILVMAVTSGHAIQLLKRYYEEYWRLREAGAPDADLRRLSRAAVVESVTRVGTVMLVAGIISALTLYSLMLSKIGMIRQFGLIAGSGMLSGLIIEMTLMPALRSLLKPPRSAARAVTHESVLAKALRRFAAHLSSERAPWVLAASCLLLLLIGSGTFLLRGDSSIMRYFAPDDPVRRADEVLNQSLGGTYTVYFLVEGSAPDSMKDPRVLSAMDRLESFLGRQPGVGKTQSLAGLVKRMNQAMHNDAATAFAIPPDQALIAQYLLLYSLSAAPGDFDSYVDNDYRRAVVWTFVRSDSTAFAEQLFAKVQPLLREFPAGVTVRIGGTLADSIAVNDVIVGEKVVNTVQMAVVVLLLASLALRSWVGGLLVLTPVVVIALANFGILGWLGIPLDMGTAVTASMAICIGADYEIYLLYRFREELSKNGYDVRLATEQSLLTSGKAVLYVAAAVAGGYSALLASDFTFYSRLATAVCVTMLVSAFSALVLLRAMILVFRPRFIFGKQINSNNTLEVSTCAAQAP